MKNILEVINVTKKYDGFILDNISFACPAGSIMGIIGPNGAGKTTIINSILNTIKLDSGIIRIFGKEHTQLTKEDKENLAVVYDENSLPDYLNSKEVGKIFSQLYVNWNNKDYIQYLERLRIPPKTTIKDMSKGNKAKINLAVALAHNRYFAGWYKDRIVCRSLEYARYFPSAEAAEEYVHKYLGFAGMTCYICHVNWTLASCESENMEDNEENLLEENGKILSFANYADVKQYQKQRGMEHSTMAITYASRKKKIILAA